MKTVFTTFVILALLVSKQINAQNKIFIIQFSEDESRSAIYPSGTNFNLVDTDSTVVFSDKNDYGVFLITKKYQLEVFPPYKSTADIYMIDKGFLEIKENNYLVKTKEVNRNVKKEHHYNKRISATKIITDSKIEKDSNNLNLKFTNGIEFSYIDGNVSATLNGKELYIDGNYSVYSKLGVLKISFRPKTGETWWYFKTEK